ncbi:MAG: hypothetical protein KDA41_03410, partial [Planctomycetales bacterium]|nr:hypothetical protein [Planctomycetales bacterium]
NRDDQAWWMRAELLALTEQNDAAVESIERAIASNPQSPLYRLTAAQLLGAIGEYDNAVAVVEEAIRDAEKIPLLIVRAKLQLAELLADGPTHDHAAALERYQEAIEAAVPLASSDTAAERRAAKKMLVAAHLGVAKCIAKGRWQKQDQIAPQWIERARAIAEELIANDGGHPALLFEVNRQKLETLAWLNGKVDPSTSVLQLQSQAEQLIDEIDDPLFRGSIRWQLAKALVDAVDIERARGNAGKAGQYGQAAEQALAAVKDSPWNNDECQFQSARLYFLLGAVQSVQLDDQAQATKLYEHALAVAGRPEPDADPARTLLRGEWLVSMGVAYWKSGDQDQGLRLTQLGAGLIKATVDATAGTEQKLSAPYHNLAFMYGQLGDQEESARYQELAAKTGADSAVQR